MSAQLVTSTVKENKSTTKEKPSASLTSPRSTITNAVPTALDYDFTT